MKARRILFIICCLALLFGCGQKEPDPAPPVEPKTYSLTITVSGEGTVAEKLVSTRSDYSSGTIVELTASPSAGWRFSRWDGDLQGEANPAEIEMTSPKTVRALFEKENYSFNVRIVGPGVVDEFLSEDTRAALSYGTKVRLAAFPAEGAVFKGWSGGIESAEPEIEYPISSSEEIIATFSYDKAARKYDLPDLYQPSSHRKQMFYGVNFEHFTSQLTGYSAQDYDRDGYVDIITCISNYSYERNNFRFYRGMPDGSFKKDEVNSDKLFAPCSNRKSVYGDFNGDGIVDIFFVGTGPELIDSDAKESPIMLWGHPDGTFTETLLTQVCGFFHGMSAGDIDNDGDLDIVLTDSYPRYTVLENDGSGNFTSRPELLNYDVLRDMYTCELFDLNHDGFLDLVIGGHDHEGKDCGTYTNTTCVFWGNGKSFNNNNFARLPQFRRGYGIVLDYYFYDIDGDGQEEIFNVRTGDGLWDCPTYCGWSIQIVKYRDDEFVDVTGQYISDEDNSETTGPAMVYIDFEEIDGELYLTGRRYPNTEKLFAAGSGKFVRIEENKTPERIIRNNGFVLYSDCEGTSGVCVEMLCGERPYSGNACIKFQDWKIWQGCEFVFNENLRNGLDMSKLYDDNYALEFYIKNIDPTLGLHFTFQSILDYDSWTVVDYGKDIKFDGDFSSGEWTKVIIPLKEFCCGPEWSAENYWKKLDRLTFWTTSDGGEEFYLDEIRIRKIL